MDLSTLNRIIENVNPALFHKPFPTKLSSKIQLILDLPWIIVPSFSPPAHTLVTLLRTYRQTDTLISQYIH